MPREPAPAAPVPAEPRGPRIFKVVDALSREVLADGTPTRATLDVLEGVRSVVDVSIAVWEPGTERWRTLTLGERQALWRLRGRGASKSVPTRTQG